MTDVESRGNDYAGGMAACAWYDTIEGAFALLGRLRLLQAALAPWPRRGRTLLEVNCGEGLHQNMLYESGFDVTGCEAAPTLRGRFVENLGTRFRVDPAHCDLLPYPDGAFDYVVLVLDGLENPSLLTRSVGEARRVAAMGMVVSFWNSLSIPGARLTKKTGVPAWPWWRVMGAVNDLRAGTPCSYGSLLLPRLTWRWRNPTVRRVLDLIDAPDRTWFGCACAIRLDFPPQRPMTARPLRLCKLFTGDPRLAREGIGFHSQREEIRS